jgi:hypothetical protein
MNDEQQRRFFGSHYNGFDEPLVFRDFGTSINPLIDTYPGSDGNLPVQLWEIKHDKKHCRHIQTKYIKT